MSLALFDFDGTITTRETMPDFLRRSVSRPRLILGQLLLAPLVLGYKLGLPRRVFEGAPATGCGVDDPLSVIHGGSMHPASMVIFLGVGMSIASWVWFRLPGQDFLFAAPVWRASRHLEPVGARLWIAGSLVSLAGMVWLVWAMFTNGA